jgi:hypothetical protein
VIHTPKGDNVAKSKKKQESPATVLSTFYIVEDDCPIRTIQLSCRDGTQTVSIQYSNSTATEVRDDGNGVTVVDGGHSVRLDYSVLEDLLIALRIFNHHNQTMLTSNSTIIKGEEIK